jgi:hypothetical protein
MPKVYSRRKGTETPSDGAVYVGRPTRWGNPFVIGQHGQQGECVDLYREWIATPERATLRAMVRQELRGKDLVCWCAPKPCHADVLLEIANETAYQGFANKVFPAILGDDYCICGGRLPGPCACSEQV